VIIGSGTWLGTNAVVVGNVRIGRNCVIGANSVVTKDIPDYCIAAGIPAKIIRQYNLATNEWEKVYENPSNK
jgi:acetyltransferase-like isoleucine patch superfamily enzyme